MQIIDAEEAIAGLMLASQQHTAEVWPWRNLGQMLASMGRVSEARAALQRALSIDQNDLASLWGAYELEQVFGNPEGALALQKRAIALAPVVACQGLLHAPPGRRSAPLAQPCRVLMLCVPGTYQANNPLEYIVDSESITLHKWFLTGGPTPELPDHDVVFNAIGYAHGVEPALLQAEQFLETQSKPVINAPKAVLQTSRAAVARLFATSQNVYAASTVQLSRSGVEQLPIDQPIVLRPLNSQAGNNFSKISYPAELVAYLASVPGIDEFYSAPFIEYANNDRLYRKYRIAFIDGQPYPVHLAISPSWMVHYYNSAMADHRWMRDEEAAFMENIYNVFQGTAAAALREIARNFDLEYFAIDCSLMPDGRVLLFEADTAMIIHMGDPIEIYPYKHEYVPRIVDALDRLFGRVAAQGCAA